MPPTCNATHTLTTVPAGPNCHDQCRDVSCAVDSVSCRTADGGTDCVISYSVTRTNADSSTDVISGSVTVAHGGCKTVTIPCVTGGTCIRAKLELCCQTTTDGE